MVTQEIAHTQEHGEAGLMPEFMVGGLTAIGVETYEYFTWVSPVHNENLNHENQLASLEGQKEAFRVAQLHVDQGDSAYAALGQQQIATQQLINEVASHQPTNLGHVQLESLAISAGAGLLIAVALHGIRRAIHKYP